MKVLLVRPPAPNILNFTKILDNEPLELEYLATALHTSHHAVLIYDALVDERSYESVLKDFKPHVVAITGYITQEKGMLKMAETAKHLLGKCVVLLGGVHAQLNYMRFYSESVDFICRSEDVWVVLDLVNLLEKHEGIEGISESDLIKLNGLVHKQRGDYLVNALEPMDINHLPIPDRQHFETYKNHFRYLELVGVATMKTAFSCPHTCNFCYCTLLSGGRYQARDMALVLDELEGINAQTVQIVDDDFLADYKRAWAFVAGVKKRQIHKQYICYARADHIVAHPDLVHALSEVGFRYFLVGLEAISTATLTSYQKNTTEDINRQAVEIVRATKSDLIALMMVSHEAKASDFDDLYDWIVANRIDYVTVSMFTPIPGTALYETYKDQLITDKIEDWDFLHLVLAPTQMTKTQFYRAYYKLFLKLYRLAKKTGRYDFMNLSYYRNLLSHYLRQQFKH